MRGSREHSQGADFKDQVNRTIARTGYPDIFEEYSLIEQVGLAEEARLGLVHPVTHAYLRPTSPAAGVIIRRMQAFERHLGQRGLANQSGGTSVILNGEMARKIDGLYH